MFFIIIGGCNGDKREPLDPTTIPKYVESLVIPPEMPSAGTVQPSAAEEVMYYEIEAAQFKQQVLPPGFPKTAVFGYGAFGHPETRNFPAFTIEAEVNKPVRVKWINGLMDSNGRYLPHILHVDQSILWANPPMDCKSGAVKTDCEGKNPAMYTGPVPIITHLHGSHVDPESDGFPEAWYLPAATNIPSGYAAKGGMFGQIAGAPGEAGAALFHYRNDQRATTLWYHDHALGITRLNVYAGLAGFYLLRGGADDLPSGVLPGPAPKLGDPAGTKYYEIPIAIQDRSFYTDGSFFYPDNRAFFEGLPKDKLNVDFAPDSDVPPAWNPEFFGNTMVVNGKTWPYLDVEQRRYRFRLLNGTNGRFLILKFDRPLKFHQIGLDGGFLPAVDSQDELLMAPARRADVIVDFSGFAPGTEILLLNLGPDEPFGGGTPGVDFASADPETTGQVMKFRVVAASGPDTSTPPEDLALPSFTGLGAPDNIRSVSLNEKVSSKVCAMTETDGSIKQLREITPGADFEERCADAGGEPFGPVEAEMGIIDSMGNNIPLDMDQPITENPALNATEIWEISNFTEDAHPIHLHQVMFELISRQPIGGGDIRGPGPGESGFMDTVIAFPGEVTAIKAMFDIPGLYVWHCHILEHEDNEMMRSYCVGPDCPLPLLQLP
jgi:bilirubin oxidase